MAPKVFVVCLQVDPAVSCGNLSVANLGLRTTSIEEGEEEERVSFWPPPAPSCLTHSTTSGRLGLFPLPVRPRSGATSATPGRAYDSPRESGSGACHPPGPPPSRGGSCCPWIGPSQVPGESGEPHGVTGLGPDYFSPGPIPDGFLLSPVRTISKISAFIGSCVQREEMSMEGRV